MSDFEFHLQFARIQYELIGTIRLTKMIWFDLSDTLGWSLEPIGPGRVRPNPGKSESAATAGPIFVGALIADREASLTVASQLV